MVERVASDDAAPGGRTGQMTGTRAPAARYAANRSAVEEPSVNMTPATTASASVGSSPIPPNRLAHARQEPYSAAAARARSRLPGASAARTYTAIVTSTGSRPAARAP